MSMGSRPAWTTGRVPGQLGLHKKLLSQEKEKERTNSSSQIKYSCQSDIVHKKNLISGKIHFSAIMLTLSINVYFGF